MEINKIINEFIKEKYYQEIITGEEFYFDKLLTLYKNYKQIEINGFKNELIDFVGNPPTKGFNFQSILDKNEKTSYYEFLILIGKLISIFDEKGYNSKIWNPYTDRRSVSRAMFTQKEWTYCLFKYKLNNFTFTSLYENKFNTFRNTINFIENPEKNINITSQNHRVKICNFFDLKDETELNSLFKEFTTHVKNPKNVGVLIANILFNDRIKSLWFSMQASEVGSSTIEKYLQSKDMKKMNHPLSQILYGPPGTGKTYNTINKAISIINQDFNLKQTREKIKEEFDRLMNAGQIVFTTFHQSMSYEDFIEGIKPVIPKSSNEPINYIIMDGIFKKACVLAAYNCYKLFSQSRSSRDKYSFDDLYGSFIDFIQEQISNNHPPVYKSLRGREVEIKEINRNGSIIARGKNSVAKDPAPLTKENLQKLYDKFQTIEEIQDLKQVKETVQITSRITEFYAVFSGLKEFEKSYKPDIQGINESKEIEALDMEELERKFNAGVFREAIKSFGKDAEPVVLIIDEINRGNVSQIFGELITLIEEDKRLGKKEALEVTLPYSKEKFGVPPNLYIIGTMNTADRSVEALDTALRRRFSFIEMPPKPELIATKGKLKEQKGILENIDLPQLLTTINKRIEKLLDKDHQIGHSYFMNVSNPEELKSAFQNKIIPLLQEYFFGDYGKIGLVLGEGFFEEEDESKEKSIFAKFQDYDSTDFSERKVYKLKNVYEMDNAENDHTNFLKAINALIGK